MSRYSIDPLESQLDDIAWVDVGWDPELRTYFGQVYECEMTDDPPIFWIGQNFQEVSTVSELAAGIAWYCGLDEDMVRQLEVDRMEDR